MQPYFGNPEQPFSNRSPVFPRLPESITLATHSFVTPADGLRNPSSGASPSQRIPNKPSELFNMLRGEIEDHAISIHPEFAQPIRNFLNVCCALLKGQADLKCSSPEHAMREVFQLSFQLPRAWESHRANHLSSNLPKSHPFLAVIRSHLTTDASFMCLRVLREHPEEKPFVQAALLEATIYAHLHKAPTAEARAAASLFLNSSETRDLTGAYTWLKRLHALYNRPDLAQYIASCDGINLQRHFDESRVRVGKSLLALIPVFMMPDTLTCEGNVSELAELQKLTQSFIGVATKALQTTFWDCETFPSTVADFQSLGRDAISRACLKHFSFPRAANVKITLLFRHHDISTS